jgi:hypothetical protein
MRLFALLLLLMLSAPTIAQTAGDETLTFRGVPMNATEKEFIERNPDFDCRDAATEDEKERSDRICLAKDTEAARTYVIKWAEKIQVDFIENKMKSITVNFNFPSTINGISSTKSIINMHEAMTPINAALKEKFGSPIKSDKSGDVYQVTGGKLRTFRYDSPFTGASSTFSVLYSSEDYGAKVAERRRPKIIESMKGM